MHYFTLAFFILLIAIIVFLVNKKKNRVEKKKKTLWDYVPSDMQPVRHTTPPPEGLVERIKHTFESQLGGKYHIIEHKPCTICNSTTNPSIQTISMQATMANISASNTVVRETICIYITDTNFETLHLLYFKMCGE